MQPTSELKRILREVFGFPDFRPSQEEVCAASAAGKDVVLVMPTGSGKSLCYQIPALARGGAALVVSPLIALMEDQVRQLVARGLRVDRIHSGKPREEAREAFRKYRDGELQFLFVAPERFRVPGFLQALQKRKPSLIAIDEAHCISQWGHDFRPDYRMLHDCVAALRPSPVIALTATATAAVQRDIAQQLGLLDPLLLVQGFRRKNIGIEVIDVAPPDRTPLLWKILDAEERLPAIVYVPSRNQADTLAAELGTRFRADAYHAGMKKEARTTVQERFLSGDLEIIVATIAFGMGIDKADIRTVVHVSLPGTIESYYQEIGRAGRDGKPSRAILMQSYADRRMHDYFFERDYPDVNTLKRIYAELRTTPMPRLELRDRAGMAGDAFDNALEKLWIHGGAIADWDDNITRGSERWAGMYEMQRRRKSEQVDLVLRFASSPQCRMSALVRYFGDRQDKISRCGVCDFCAPESCASGQFVEASEEQEQVARRVLQALQQLPSRSTGRLHSELCGNGRMLRNEFEEVLGSLARAGLLAITDETFEKDGKDVAYRAARLTPDGRRLEDVEPLHLTMRRMRGQEGREKHARKSEPGKTRPRAAIDREDPLFRKLRAWRSAKAKAKGVPAFCVFADSTLEEIVDSLPESDRDLLGIRGIGPRSLKEFGGEILQLVSESLKEEDLAGS